MNHYCLDTGSGQIELSKGAYLTMLKRKLPTIKIVNKHKPINSHWCDKKTVKKPLVKSVGRSIRRN